MDNIYPAPLYFFNSNVKIKTKPRPIQNGKTDIGRDRLLIGPLSERSQLL